MEKVIALLSSKNLAVMPGDKDETYAQLLTKTQQYSLYCFTDLLSIGLCNNALCSEGNVVTSHLFIKYIFLSLAARRCSYGCAELL